MVSLPLEKKGEGQKIAVKIVDDRGVESLLVRHLSGGKVMEVEK